MLSRVLETGVEVIAQLVVFALAFSLSTGMACNPKVMCDDSPRDEAAEVATP